MIDCVQGMTSRLNKRKQIFHYKCSKLNKTVNVNTRIKSIHNVMYQQYSKVIESQKFSEQFHNLFPKQLEKIINYKISNLNDKRRMK